MSGYMSVIAPCFACGRLFMSNPSSVPAFQGQPICRTCIVVVNAKRAAAGLPTWPVADDAYEAEEVEH